MGYRFGPVVVGVDGSADSVGALRWAADEACRNNRELIVVHAIDPAVPADDVPPGSADLAARAADEAVRWRPGVCATGVTATGSPAEVLRRYTRQARLVVVASHGCGNNMARPLGSVCDDLCLDAECPVLAVHAARRWADPFTVLPQEGPVVAGFDGSESAGRALRLAFEEAAGRGQRLVVLQVWQHPELWLHGRHHEEGRHHGPDLSSDESAVHEALVAAAEPWRARHPLVEMELRSEPGDPVEALVLASQWATLMVLGTSCRADPFEPPSHSVLHRVLRGMACPALIAHGTVREHAAPEPRVAHPAAA